MRLLSLHTLEPTHNNKDPAQPKLKKKNKNQEKKLWKQPHLPPHQNIYIPGNKHKGFLRKL